MPDDADQIALRPDLGPDRDVLRYDATTQLLEDKPLPCISNF